MRKQHVVASLAWSLGLFSCMHPRAIVLAPSAPQGVRVTGVGEASAAPNVARTRVGVDVRAATADQASSDAKQRMTAVLAALKQLGIADKDLRTSNYTVTFEHVQAQPSAAATDAAQGVYRVSNVVDVTIRDLASTGRVLQAASSAGANTMWGVTFDLEDDTALVAQARKAAVADAQRVAGELAQLAGIELGEVVSLSENDQPNTYSGGGAGASDSDVPIEHGEISVRYSVQVVYATHSK